MDDVAYVRRVMWLPSFVPFVLAAMDDLSNYSVGSYIQSSLMLGAATYPAFVLISRYAFRADGRRAHWALLFASPIAFPVFYASVNGTIWYSEDGWGIGLYVFMLFYSLVLCIPLGYAFALVAWAARRLWLRRDNAA